MTPVARDLCLITLPRPIDFHSPVKESRVPNLTASFNCMSTEPSETWQSEVPKSRFWRI